MSYNLFYGASETPTIRAPCRVSAGKPLLWAGRAARRHFVLSVSDRSARPNSGVGLLRKAQMKIQHPGQLVKLHEAQNSAAIAHSRLTGGTEIPDPQIPSKEDLLAAKGALRCALRAVLSLLGISGSKGGA